MLHYYPPIIKNLISRVRRLRYPNDVDIEAIKAKHQESMSSLQNRMIKESENWESESSKNIIPEDVPHESSSHDCQKFPYPYILVNVALSEVEGDVLHPKYATPFIKVKIGETMIDYDMFVDHDELKGSLGGIHVYDLTNYPYTLDPRNIGDFKKTRMFEVLGLRDADEKNTLSLDCKFYQETCPLKRPKVKNTVKLYVASIKYHFQLDLLMRVKDYFFDRLLDSVTETDPYASEKKPAIEEKLIKFYEKNEVTKFDLKQENAIVDVHIEVKNPCIILKARNHYNEEFSIFLGNIFVSSEIITEKGKWTLDPDKEVRMNSFKINIENTEVQHNNSKMGSINFIKVDVRQLIHSTKLEYIDPLSLNRALCIGLEFSPINIHLSKKQFTYLMKCLDLNINYDDGMRELYDFRLKKDFTEVHKIKEDYKTMIIKIKMTCISLSLYFLNEFLTEIVCHDLGIDIDKFASFKNIIDVYSTTVWAFGEESEETGYKEILAGPLGCGNSVYTDASFYKYEVKTNPAFKNIDSETIKNLNCKIKMHNGEKDINVELDNLKLFLKMHIFMLLFHFFTEGLPKYDIDDADLPNQYDNDVENAPRLTFKTYLNNSLICLDDLRDTIACRIDICLIYDRLNIRSIKEELMKQKFSEENTFENTMVCQELRFNIFKCNPFFCKYADLDGSKSLKKINKRELIKPFALCYSSKNRVERYSVENFRINTTTDITVEKVSVKISIQQIVSFLSMIRNTSNILQEKYIEKITKDESQANGRNVNSSSPKKSLFSTYDTSEDAQRFKETFEVFSNRYYQVPKKKVTSTYEVEDDIEEKDAIVSKQENLNKLKSPIKMNKNTVIEEEKKEFAEPIESKGKNTFNFFFHGLSIFFINDYRDNSYPVLCLSLKDTNYIKDNRVDGSFVSQSQLEASFDYYNIKNGYWEPFVEGLDIEFQYDKQLESKVIQVKAKESINLNISPDFVAVLNYCLKSWEEAQKSLKDTNTNQNVLHENQDMFSEEVKHITDGEIKTKDQIALFTFDEEEDIMDIATPYRIRNLTGNIVFIETLFGEKKDKYVLNDNQTTKIAISYDKQTTKNFDGINSKMNDNVKILFEGLHLPIDKIALNKLGQGMHKLTDNEEKNDYLFYETKVIDMNKVLTIRTQNLLINSTQFSYIIITKDVYDKTRDRMHKIRPGESVSFPRELIDCKICIKTIEDKEYSNLIPAKRLIFQTAVGHTNFIRSGNTFTMIRKEQNKTMKECFDIHLIPPIRVKNGLPVTMQLTLVGQDFEMLLEKAEERHISFYSPDEMIQLAVKLDGYEAEPLAIKFLKKSYEKSIKLQSIDNKHSNLHLYANFTDDKAGCYVTFFAKTCFINASSCPLSIYNTSTNMKGIYIPSVSSWRNLVLASDITHCYFTLDKESASEEIQVEGGSMTGQVSVMKASTREMAELVYTTNLSLVDVNQSIYTKVITILPKYVIINKTSEKLLLTQEKLDDDFTIIDSFSRENFRWLDGKGIKKAMIKILDNNGENPIKEWMWSSPFSLEEIGAHSVRNVNSSNPDKFMYWKIDRRIQNDIIFITIDKEDEKHPLYRIDNNASDIILKYKQKDGVNWEY